MADALTAPTDEPPRSGPPFNPALVEELLRQLDKTVRAHQLYSHNNPTYLRALEALRASFAPVWAETDELTLSVSDLEFTWSGVVVHRQAERASDSLPWTFYKDGLREVTLKPGFEGPELEFLLDIIPRVRKAASHEDDLITLLWEQEFSGLTYRYIDVANDAGIPIDPGAEPGRWPADPGVTVESPLAAIEEARREASDPGARDAQGADAADALKESPRGVVKMEDFDSTLYFLDAGEVSYLRDEAEREYTSDLRRTVLAGLLDVFETQTSVAIREEVTRDIDALTLHLLAGRQFSTVAFLLREIGTVLERAQELTPELRGALASLPDRLSDPAALSQLLRALDEAESLPPRADLEELFAQLRPTALGTVFGWLGATQNVKLRPLLEGAAERLAQSNTAELLKLIVSADPAVAMEAIKRAGGFKSVAAVPALGRALVDPDRAIRLATVTALLAIGTPGAMQAIERAIEDTDRDVRVAAVRALGQNAYRPALPKITALVQGNKLRDADRTERLAIFELYGMLCGDGGVPWLDQLLNPKGGLFTRKIDPEIRACAAIALGHVGTQRSLAALQKALAEKNVVVRGAGPRRLRASQAATSSWRSTGRCAASGCTPSRTPWCRRASPNSRRSPRSCVARRETSSSACRASSFS
jgi:HEAT repeat protein